MEYTHTENGFRMIFADEKDYLRCKLLFLEEFNNDVSTNTSFDFFMRRGLYQGFEERGRIECRVEIEPREVVTIPISSNSGLFSNRNSSESGLSARQEMMREHIDDLNQQDMMRQGQHPLHDLSDSRRRRDEELMRLYELTSPSPVVILAPRQIDEKEFGRESYAEPTVVEPKKEEVIEKKPRKKKTVFDIIDID